MTIRAQKRAMRREVVARILALSPAERNRQEARLLAEFCQLSRFVDGKTVLFYVAAFPEEIATWPFLQLVLDLGKTLVLPRVNGVEKKLELIEVKDLDRDLVIEERLGIPEPAGDNLRVAVDEIDWVIVPGIAFDLTGNRLGRGGGYYDRLLPQLRPQTPRWALLYDEQWVERVPVQAHDARVTGLWSASRKLDLTS